MRGIERVGPYNHNLDVLPFKNKKCADIGDVPFRSRFKLDSCIEDIEKFYHKVVDAGVIPLTVGGDHSITHPILKALGFKVGVLNHHFTINPTINKFKLITIPIDLTNSSKSILNFGKKKLELLNTKLQLNLFGKNIRKLVKKFGKDQSYFIKRYMLHPYYKYKIYLIYLSNNVLGFFVTRVCEFQGKKALRIVDFFGHDEALIGINNPLQKLIININAEYADFYEYAIDSSIMLQTGLLKNRASVPFCPAF